MANQKLTSRGSGRKRNTIRRKRGKTIKKGGYVYGGKKRKSRRGGYVYGGKKGGSSCNKIKGGNLGIKDYYPHNTSGGLQPPAPGGNDVMKGGAIFTPHDNSPVSFTGTTLGAPAFYNLLNASNNANSDAHSLDNKYTNTMV